ncbi:hypothetical protein EW145_g3523 [Phellinidium pouzarii]|uniref:Uncharacterized protein n=1 Tax=Phellinidium pouzarii TaxID=167371 RepID=A0A4S4L6S0_9AGAM|nr:hypothetical protein EW145_g3523 [Phellinidium pouzarii]
MASGPDVAETRRHILQQFAFKRQSNQLPNSQQPFSASSSSPLLGGMPSGPPAQARDATNSSRYFPTTSLNGTVLVPNSSPIGQDSKYQPYQTYQSMSDSSSMSNFNQHNSWTQNMNGHADPLSRPSGFVASTGVNNAPITRPTPPPTSVRRMVDDGERSDSDRPRKRAHLNQSSSDPLDMVLGSPPSPEIARAGQKRRLASNKSFISPSSQSSADESLPDTKTLLPGSSKSRIVRGDRPVDTALQRLRVANAWIPKENVDAAYHMSNGDIRRASHLLLDPNFSPPSRQTPSVTSTQDTLRVVGKVKEVDEEREAKRIHQKEIAAKSAIYKRRATVDQPSSSTSVMPLSPAAADPESSPTRIRPSRSKPRKQVIESASEDESEVDVEQVNSSEKKAWDSLNTFGADALRELTGCTSEQALKIIALRPYVSVDDLKKRLGQEKKKAGPAGISPHKILQDCERIGKELKNAVASWTGKGKEREHSQLSTFRDDASDDGALNLVSIVNTSASNGFIDRASSFLAPGVQLKDYQIIGVNWLRLLHSKKYSCILADEMGLGKTIQVISFFAQLKEEGCVGPHLIIVPSSTLENWCREFERFAPSITIETYYGNKDDRSGLREHLLSTQLGRASKSKAWDVLITTYTLATCVFDEGHVLKNFQSQRYSTLTRINSEWKLLLTGTPLQNNLQELVSVMNFILPDQFGGEEGQNSLRAIFKVKGDSKQLLAEERVKRAKKMMTPFVLRRRKDQVLKDLPKKTERIEWCTLTPLQKSIYDDARRRSRKTVIEETESKEPMSAEDANVLGMKGGGGKQLQKKGRSNPRAKEKKYLENTSNVLMDLRKAASHPMLFRTQFSDSTLTSMTRMLLKEPDFKKRGAIFEFVKEDMEVMTDAELQAFCGTYKSTQRFRLDDDCYIDAGKVTVMLSLLERYQAEGRKCLIFSQFTQILDILQVILKQRSIRHLVLTGSTAVDVRQGLVDEFTEDQSIPVFLLSTKAGGMGINLTAASVVILFDQDFNPHNDRQAADRAYRIGQKRDVEIVKLISRGTIEEDMLRLGATKLALDEAVAGDTEESGETKAEKIMRSSLMETLRKQFEEEDKNGPSETTVNGATFAAVENKPSTKVMDVDSEAESELTDLEGS